MRDTTSTTVEAAAAWAREDSQVDRPTLGEVLADEREDLLAWADGWEDE